MMLSLTTWFSFVILSQLAQGRPADIIAPKVLQPRQAYTTYASQSCSASSIPPPALFGAQITALSAHEVHNYSIALGEGFSLPAQNYTNLAFCQVNITYTHPGVNDSVHVQVWLPLSGWNGRFQGTGGGGYVTGLFDTLLAPAVQRGFSAASTDGGHPAANGSSAGWALLSPGNVNYNLLVDFASKTLHDMAVLGKAVTESFYGTAPSYSYWNGCSTGGRQGLMEAQRYPGDYDGILAAAPAVNWATFVPAGHWPQVVMDQLGVFPDQCEFNAITAAAVAACDSIDGVTDGIISATDLCQFDPHSIVGQTFTCSTDGTTRTYSSAAATIVQEFWGGPHNSNGKNLWYGYDPGAPLSGIGFTNRSATGTSYGVPFFISEEWIRLFVEKDPTFNTGNLTFDQFASILHQSYQEYNSIIGTEDPDLSAFRNAGGKIITWHGLADQLIPPNNTVDYYQRVQALDPQVQDFFRVFFAPGVEHCAGGIGPYPDDTLSALVNWVECGIAPDTLAATSQPVNGSVIHRPLCVYPLVARWNGVGDVNQAASFSCSPSYA